MKRLFISLLLFAALSFCANAQQIIGTFEPLVDAGRAKLIIDFDKADMMGMTEKEFYTYEEDWGKDKIEVVNLIYTYANKVLKGKCTLGNYQIDTKFILYLQILSIDMHGNFDSDLVLTYTEDGATQELGHAIGLHAKGGKFGTKLNLIKDGAQSTGEAIGRLIMSQID